MADVIPPTPGGSLSNNFGGTVRKANLPDFDFNLNQTKERIARDFTDSVPANFKKFFNSPLYDRTLNTLMLYFVAILQRENIVKAVEKARRQHLEGFSPHLAAARMAELEVDAENNKLAISPLYAEILMKHSSYEKPQQDRMFFENLYETLVNILDVAFSRLSKRSQIEQEVGLMFRSKHFNFSKRKNAPPRSVDTLSVKELYAVKHETSNRALNSKLLSSLFEKPAVLGVQEASWTNSPLIMQFITSPITARSITKSPEARAELAKSLHRMAEQAQQDALQTHSTSQLNQGSGLPMLTSSPGRRSIKAFPSMGSHAVRVQSTADLGATISGSITAGNSSSAGPIIGSVANNNNSTSNSGSMHDGADSARGRPKPNLSIATGGTFSSGNEAGHGPLSSILGGVGSVYDEVYVYLDMVKRYVVHGPSLGVQEYQVGPPTSTVRSVTWSHNK